MVSGVNYINLELSAGSTAEFEIFATNDGTSVDLSSYHWRFMAKWSESDSDSEAVLDLSDTSGQIIAGPTSLRLLIQPSDYLTSLPYETVTVKYALGVTPKLPSPQLSKVVVKGDLIISPPIIRSF